MTSEIERETCARCDFKVQFHNGGWIHVAPKALLYEAMEGDIEGRVNAFLHLTRDHAAEPNRGA